MADRFWVGGTATWNGTAGARWSLTSGGASGASVPSTSDRAVFDANSGAAVVTLAAALTCAKIDCTGFTGTLTGSANFTIGGAAVAGGLTLVSGMTYSSTGNITFAHTTTGSTITMAGKTVAGTVTFNGAGGGWQLQDALSAGTNSITLTAGTLDLNGQTMTCGIFNSSNSNTRALTFGSGTITCSSTGTAWTTATTTGLTFTKGTGTVTLSGAGATITAGSLVFYNLLLTGAGITMTNVGTSFNNFTYTGAATKTATLPVAAYTVTGTLTLAGNSTANRLFVASSAIGTSLTITCNGTVTTSNCDFRDITGAGSASWNISAATGGSGDCGGNSGITFTTPANQYWFKDTGNYSTTANWFLATNGGGGAGRIPLPQDTAKFDANSFSAGSKILSLDMPRVGGIDFTGTTNTPALSDSGNSGTGTLFHGSLVLGTITLTNFNSSKQLLGRGSYNLNGNNISQTASSWTLNAPGGTYTLSGILKTSANNSSLTITAGTLTTNNFNITATTFTGPIGSDAFSITVASGATLTLGSSSVDIRGFSNSGTCNAGTSTFVLWGNAGGAATFAGNGGTYYNLTIDGGYPGGGATITGSNTFNTLTFSPDGNTVTDAFIYLTPGTTTIISSLASLLPLGGIGGTNRGFLRTTSSGVQATLSSANQIYLPGLVVLDNVAAGAGIPFYAGTGGTDQGNNSNWNFTAPPVANSGSALMFAGN